MFFKGSKNTTQSQLEKKVRQTSRLRPHALVPKAACTSRLTLEEHDAEPAREEGGADIYFVPYFVPYFVNIYVYIYIDAEPAGQEGGADIYPYVYL
jgi:hypothetical protein